MTDFEYKNPSQSLCDSSPEVGAKDPLSLLCRQLSQRASRDLPPTQGEVASQKAMTERAKRCGEGKEIA